MKRYFEVPVTIDGEAKNATFGEEENENFDLVYGWAVWISGPHSSLESAIGDFQDRLREEYPDKDIVIGEPVEIDAATAKSNSPNA